MDETRAQRDGGDLGDMLRANMAAMTTGAVGPEREISKVIKDAFAALNAFADEFVMYRDRVEELDGRLATAQRERDAAYQEIDTMRSWLNNARERADLAERNLRAESDRWREHTCEVASPSHHVCVPECRPNSHVAFRGRKLIEEKDSQIKSLVDKTKRLIEDRDAARKMRDEALNRIEIVARERDEARERAGQWDVDRHTEKHRADSLKRQVETQAQTIRAYQSELAEQQSLVSDLNTRTAELQRWLDRRDECQREAERDRDAVRAAWRTIRESFMVITDTVAAEAVDKALNADHTQDNSKVVVLADVVRQVRHEVRRIASRKALASPSSPSSPE